jgi:hypothetical protein
MRQALEPFILLARCTTKAAGLTSLALKSLAGQGGPQGGLAGLLARQEQEPLSNETLEDTIVIDSIREVVDAAALGGTALGDTGRRAPDGAGSHPGG